VDPPNAGFCGHSQPFLSMRPGMWLGQNSMAKSGPDDTPATDSQSFGTEILRQPRRSCCREECHPTIGHSTADLDQTFLPLLTPPGLALPLPHYCTAHKDVLICRRRCQVRSDFYEN